MMTKGGHFYIFHEWYQRNRKKYWVIVFLTVGFIIGLPFVIIGIFLEIAFQKDQNNMEQNGLDEDNNEDEDELRKLDAELELDHKKDEKTNENYSECPVCGSKSIKMYRFPPLFLTEYVCEDCDYSGTSINKIHNKPKSKIIHNICLNCGS